MVGITQYNTVSCVLINGGAISKFAMDASTLSMLIITFERCVKIVWPIQHRNHFRRWMIAAGVGISWLGAAPTCVVMDFVGRTYCLEYSKQFQRVFTYLFLNFLKIFKLKRQSAGRQAGINAKSWLLNSMTWFRYLELQAYLETFLRYAAKQKERQTLYMGNNHEVNVSNLAIFLSRRCWDNLTENLRECFIK